MATLIKTKKAVSKKSNGDTARRKAVVKKRSAQKKDIADSYDRYKIYGGKQYTGVQVGRGHKWYYDKGEWKDSKITPDLWRIFYSVTKRRAGKAPKGSGAKIGTAYHWYIVAHQKVEKLNANDYSTTLMGLKYKVAHKRADKGRWSAKTATQRSHLVKFLKEWIKQLETEAIPLEFEYNGENFKGEAVPIPGTCGDGVCFQLDITLNDECFGIIRSGKSGWKMDAVEDQKFVNAIGQEIMLYYE